MKRMIRANADNKVPFHNRKYNINIEVVDEKHGFFRGQIIKIAPYDDAEYVWAKIESNGLERRDNWLANVLDAFPKIKEKYEKLFNYGK